MKEYDLRDAGMGCINNAVVALMDVLSKGNDAVAVLIKKADIDEKSASAIAKLYEYAVESYEDRNDHVRIVFRKL